MSNDVSGSSFVYVCTVFGKVHKTRFYGKFHLRHSHSEAFYDGASGIVQACRSKGVDGKVVSEP